MNDLEIVFDYDRIARTLTVRAGNREYITAAGTEIGTMVELLGEWLVEETADKVYNLEVKPYDEHVRNAHIVSIRVPRVNADSRE